MTVIVPGWVKTVAKEVTGLTGQEVHEFIKTFLSQFDDPQSWVKTIDPETVKFSFERYWRKKKWRFKKKDYPFL